MTPAKWVILGIPGDRRSRPLREAFARLGMDSPLEVSWLAFLAHPNELARHLDNRTCLRIESPGSHHETWQALCHMGGGFQEIGNAFGRWQPGAARFRGLGLALGTIADLVRASGTRVLNHPDEIRLMSDKVCCRRHLAAQGLPIPEGIEGVGAYDDLRQGMSVRGWHQVFIKPRWGSSGAGVIAYRSGRGANGPREVISTTIELDRSGSVPALYLRKRLQIYRDQADIAAIIDAITGDGAVVERWIPKMTTPAGAVDVRFLLVGGRCRHRVGRAAHGPITNLHLDAQRLDADVLMAEADQGAREAVDTTLSRVAGSFPRAWYLGVDLALTRGFRRHCLLEINAWGDLLPGLLHAGEDTFAAEIGTFTRACPS